jgi:hypothetical protein
LNGELKPCAHDFSIVRIGMFWVLRVCSPGPNTSAICPSFTKMAACPSRTVSFAPILISLLFTGNR